MARRIPVREILRLRASGLSATVIVRTQPVSKTSVIDTFHAADERGVAWEDVEGMPDAEAYAPLFPERAHEGPVYRDPDWDRVHRELARVGVTLRRLHEECRDDARSKGEPLMSYDRFRERFRGFTVRRQVVSRVGHGAGRILEVDWAGPTMSLVDPASGEVSKVCLFVTCLPFSRMSYVEPTLDMREDTWPRRHAHAFAYMGGSTPRMVPDNLRTGVRAHPREGELNEACREMAAHHGSAAMPARVATPRDKPSAENEVWQAAPEIIAALRDEVLTDFSQPKRAVAEKPEEHNSRPLSRREGTRREVFEGQERPLLRPPPAVPHEACEWVYGRRAQRSCHVAHRRNYYSVGHPAVDRTVDPRVTDTAAGALLAGERLATRPPFPSFARNRHPTHAGDLPGGRSHSDWDAGRTRRRADRAGPSRGEAVGRISRRVDCEGGASTRPSPRSGSSTATRGRGWRGRARWRSRAARPRPGTGTSSPSSRPARTRSPGRARTTAGPAGTRPATCAAPTYAGRRRAMGLSVETRRRLRDMGAADPPGAPEAQDEGMCMGMACAERVQTAVGEARSAFVTSKARNLAKRANLRCPEADVRSIGSSEERGLDRPPIAELATCGFAERGQSVVPRGPAGAGKTYLARAIAKAARQRRMRARCIRCPDLEEPWREARERPGGERKVTRKCAAFQALALDEWLLDRPDELFRGFLPGLMGARHGTASTVLCTQFRQKDWHARLGGGVHADAIMDRIVHGAAWVGMGEMNMRRKLGAGFE